MEHVWANIKGLALHLVCPTSVVPYAADNGGDVSLCHRDGLAVVQRLDRGQQVSVLLEEVGQLQQVQAPLLGRRLAPYALEGLPGGGDCNINIFLGTLVDGADDLLGCWVDDLELLLVDALDPLVVDEPGRGVTCELDAEVPGATSNLLGWTYRPMGCLYLPVAGVWSSANRDMLVLLVCLVAGCDMCRGVWGALQLCC